MAVKVKVHYLILGDMEKYIGRINHNKYERNGDETDPSVILYLRDYYDSHLPVDVSAWQRVNQPRDTLIWKESMNDQIRFVRDILCDRVIYADMGWDEHEEPMVVSFHNSKSVKLPVFKITRTFHDKDSDKDLSIEFILRCNIYDWKISVKSDKPLDCDFMELFDPTKVIDPWYCEGFPKGKVYGSYEQNHSEFTIELLNTYNVYTFFFLIRNYLGIENDQVF